ncbi:WD40 repeat-like protein [Pholiota conissans]|uniref:WD40 repeat-like protein n=1 Tax=Pholiota conissans TaxID=109636 RepID=A0A9P5ZBS9_9AGAR|nr:WD40 repeat-like protein [Pholiota conissans]
MSTDIHDQIPRLLPSLTNLSQKASTTSDVERLRRWNLFRALNCTLDRVNVLEGHSGCVNALSWAEDGNLLISGGDDTTVRLWSIDPSQTIQEYPFTCTAVVNTGHRANIFNAKMLPHSSRVATAAGDAQIRVFDVKTALASANLGKEEISHSFAQTQVAIIRCHRDSIKRIVTEDSPDIFLSVSEDGTVRQHDLRTPHDCHSGSCTAPLIDIGHELSTLSLSPLSPHELVVAGEAPYGYLFDRRHLRRTIESNWGAIPNAGQGATTCVRRFGRQSRSNNSRYIARDHITGARISDANGHEVILSYSGDAVYLYSTKDDPEGKDDMSIMQSSLLASEGVGNSSTSEPAQERDMPSPNLRGVSISRLDESLTRPRQENHSNVPIVLPRHRYIGLRNIATVKDVNFFGPDDEWVVSGSDDGNFFIWNKSDGNLHGIYEGDGSVVNVVEGHPHFPLAAVSGIDNTVKLFSPTSTFSSFSRMDNAEQIIETNRRAGSAGIVRADLAALQVLADLRNAMDNEGLRPTLECTHQ